MVKWLWTIIWKQSVIKLCVSLTFKFSGLITGALMTYVSKKLGFVMVKTIVVTTQTKPTAPTTPAIRTNSLAAMATVFLGATYAMERTTVQTAQTKTRWYVGEHPPLLAPGVLLVVVTGLVWLWIRSVMDVKIVWMERMNGGVSMGLVVGQTSIR